MENSRESEVTVNFSDRRNFATVLRSDLKETFFADDPFQEFRNEPPKRRTIKIFQYCVPMLEWLPKYNFQFFRYDFLAGITIASLAIPQGISYAKLAEIPPIIGLYSSFIPPFVYAVFGTSKYLAVGTIAASSLLIASTIKEKVSPDEDPTLYLNLVFTTAFCTGILQTILGVLRLGIFVDFLSHSTITGFMGGTATIISLQQLKGFLGLKQFTTKTNVVSVLKAVFKFRHQWRWESALLGIIFFSFLLFTVQLRKKKPQLFWVSAVAPMVTVVIGCIIAYFADGDKHGIHTVGPLKKGLNPISIYNLNFNSAYIMAPIKAGLITGILATTEGIAIGRSFAMKRNEQTDGNKEMIAFGLMNLVGSFTSCYLTTGPFSKTAVNFNAGARTPMANVVMALCMMLILLFLAPVFRYTPQVCLSIVRALLYVARPATCKLGNIPNSALYRDVEQYPAASGVPGIIVLQLGSPIYFANCIYLKERIMRWVRDEQGNPNSKTADIEHVLLDLGGVTTIDMTGIETLVEIRRNILAKGIKMGIINPRINVLEKMMLSKFVDLIGKESIFLSVEDAVKTCQFSLNQSPQKGDS
ncbi:probable sulfate transporter 3.5 isoform X2 [Vitis riparia]|uniref:probable sulfate transporter 3.5 isoform X2 n=1 Tax=Vitis riparia TaxID=96939 RepID=UPI00155A2F9A|nr:probable sulfate transporter 3.5 isoform X2 [Vitis riparia]